MVAASSLLTPSLTVLGAPSTRSLASLRPRLVTSRTALMTLILLPPTSVSTTVNSVFSSAGAAPPAAAPPPPATTVAAAAETPKASSIFFTRSDASSSVRPLISSRIVSTFDMTLSSPLEIKILLGCFGTRCGSCFRTGPAGPKLVGLHRFAHHYGNVARQSVQCHGHALRRSVQQEHHLADKFFLGREIRELLNLRDRDDPALDQTRPELKCRNIFGDLCERLGQRHGVRIGESDGVRAAQILQQA